MPESVIPLSAECGDGLIDDDGLIPALNIAYIACGGRSMGDPAIEHCIGLCLRHGVAIGAAPSSQERAGMGTRIALMTPQDIAASVTRQIQTLRDLATRLGATVTHVRLNGTLNAFAGTDPDIAAAVTDALAALDPGLILVAGSQTHLHRLARGRVLAEVAADRRYERDGTLAGKSLPGALIEDASHCADQVLRAVRGEGVRAIDGATVALRAEVVHLDAGFGKPAARAVAIRRLLSQAKLK
jgi:5-oxoprolinase (ATP-hydrolysing) subunit A